MLSMHAPFPMMAVFVGAGVALFMGVRYVAGMAPGAPMSVAEVPRARSQQAMARLEAQNLARFVFRYLHEHKRLPVSLDQLVEKEIMPALPRDPWGQDYVLRIVNAKRNRFQVISPGPDGRMDTPDDVTAGG